MGVARAWHGPTLNASGGTALPCLSLSHLCWHEDSSLRRRMARLGHPLTRALPHLLGTTSYGPGTCTT